MMNVAKKVTSIVISVILVFTFCLTASADGGSYKNWLQSDSRWGSKRLGVSWETMSQVGCAVTSVAMLAVHSGSVSESNFNPGKLCDYLSNNNGFDSYANLYWGAVSGLVPGFTFKKKASLSSNTKAGITNELATYINQGYYIILSVNYDSHWIAIDTIKDGVVYMMDPAQNRTDKLFDYYKAEGMLQVRLYKGVKAPAKANEPAEPDYLPGHYKTMAILNLRAVYNTSSNILKTIPTNTDVIVRGIYNGNWGQVEYDGKTGYICLEYTKYTENLYSYKNGKYKVNAAGGVYMRSGAGTQNSITCLVPYNAIIYVTSVSGGWGKALYNDKSGWICMEYVNYAGISTAPVTTTAAKVTTKVTTQTTKATTKVTTKATTKSTTKVTTKATTKSTTKATTKLTTNTTTTQTTAKTTTVTTAKPIKGDVNRDGKLSKMDLIIINNYIARPVVKNAELHYIMDVNNDNIIDERDSVYLMTMILNKGK